MEQEIEAGIFDFKDPVWEQRSKNAQDFVATLLRVKPETRPDAKRALRHRWFRLESSQCPVISGSIKAKEFDNMLTDLSFHQTFLNCVAFHGSFLDIVQMLDVFHDTMHARVGLISKLQLKQVMEDSNFSSELIETVFSNFDIDDGEYFPYDGLLRQVVPACGRVLEMQLVRGFEIIGGSSITLNVVYTILGPYVAEALRVNDILGTVDRMPFPTFLRHFDRHITDWLQTYVSEPATRIHITRQKSASKLNESNFASHLGALSNPTNSYENENMEYRCFSDYHSKVDDRHTVVLPIQSRSNSHTIDGIKTL